MAAKSSIVIELQQLASDGKTAITDLLRKAMAVAMKLDRQEFRGWVQSELSGYNSSVPDYRVNRWRLSGFNPRFGPMLRRFADLAIEEKFARPPSVSLSRKLSSWQVQWGGRQVVHHKAWNGFGGL